MNMYLVLIANAEARVPVPGECYTVEMDGQTNRASEEDSCLALADAGRRQGNQ